MYRLVRNVRRVVGEPRDDVVNQLYKNCSDEVFWLVHRTVHDYVLSSPRNGLLPPPEASAWSEQIPSRVRKLQAYMLDLRLRMHDVWREEPNRYTSLPSPTWHLEIRPARELRNILIYIMHGETNARGWPGHT